MIKSLFVSLTILLYSAAWYQGRLTSRKWDLTERVVYNRESYPLNKEPYYSEGFVNEEISKTICHVSSITPVDDNTIACVWYSGSREGASDVVIKFSTFDEKKGVWLEPKVLIDCKQYSRELKRFTKKIGNPLIFCDKNGHIWLFYSSVAIGGWSGSSLNYKVSSDGGKSWSKSRKLILSPFLNLTNNVKNKGINFDDGSFLIPVYHEFIKKYSQLLWVKPEKNGVSFQIKKITHEMRAIQPSLLHTGKKNFMSFFRNSGEKLDKKNILMAYSHDLGKSWSELTNTTLPNPNSGFDMIVLGDGSLLGVINNSFENRSNLTMVLSRDKGSTWKVLKILENTQGSKYSYPSINRSDSGLYHITYTFERKRIKHIVFNEAWIKKLNESDN